MRLLQRSEAGDFSLVEFVGPVPEYAILSHTWGSDAEEPTFGDLVDGTGKSKAGFDKIRFCIEQAAKDGLHYAWVDTCCIDKRSSSELSEAINSMFRWYQNATRCYVYLADVSGDDSTDVLSDFQRSRWFQRAWTLQELLAPRSVEFFTSRRARLGDRSSLVLDIHSRTGIPIRALQGSPLSLFSVRERMSWTAGREAKREEDRAYSLLGIFDIHMPMLYGEKMENAFRRLNKEIEESQDVSSAENMEGVVMSGTISKTGFGFHIDRVHMIPNFTARSEYTEALGCLLPAQSSGQKVFVLYGLGGIGKTQLALRFAKDHQDAFSSIFFLNGSSQDSLLESFAAIYRRITEGGPQKTKEKMVEEVFTWLNGPQNSDWLLILDNIDKEPSDEGGYEITRYFPSKDHGSILVTTRLAPLSKLGRAKRVGRMSEKEAAGLLGDIIGQSKSFRPEMNDKDNVVHELLQTLDGLPLAISQAARFINTLNLNLETYMELYVSSKKDLMDVVSGDSDIEDSNEQSIRATWTTSLNLLRTKATRAGPDSDFHAAYRLLKLFAYFAPTDLNYNIIRCGVIGNNVPAWFRRAFRTKIHFFRVIRILLDLCLVDNNTTEGSYSMHRVVHDWLCTYVCVETDRELMRLAVGAIFYFAPLVRTVGWFWDQQQLALHAVHIMPRLKNIHPEDFYVSYVDMSTEELELVVSLLDEPVHCWQLMAFDYSLIGISRLLESCTSQIDALQVVLWAQSSHIEANEQVKKRIHAMLSYASVSCHGEDENILPSLSEHFLEYGSHSWAMKAQNLYALSLEDEGLRSKAVRVWEASLEESWEQTRNLFVHPTLMIFNNLEYRLSQHLERRLYWFERFEEDATGNKNKVPAAKRHLREIRIMRHFLGEGRDQYQQHLVQKNLGAMKMAATAWATIEGKSLASQSRSK